MPSELVSASLFEKNARSALEWRLHWLFRVAVFCEFLGHGAFGILTKKAWVSYFAVFGIPEAWAYRLMPLVGSMDILMATLTLVSPIRAALLYMTFWGLFTSLLRPLAGEGWWEFFERAYNFGVPGLMLWFHGPATGLKGWFAVITGIPKLTADRSKRCQWALRIIMASMLIGHGGYGLVMHKQNLVQFYEAAGFGISGMPMAAFSAAVGAFEILLGLLCLVVKWTPFFIFVFVWKLGTEFLYVPAHAYGAGWEMLERGGGYAAPLLWVVLDSFKHPCTKK
jgi:hypothetical protein